MAHREHEVVIRAWLDGATIQYKDHFGDWKDSEADQPGFFHHIEYRIKPAEPEAPVSQMSEEDFRRLLVQNRGLCESTTMARIVANAALRHACDNGQIVTRAEFDRAVGDRQKRDMAVAEAVHEACLDKVRSMSAAEIWMIDLDQLIAEIK